MHPWRTALQALKGVLCQVQETQDTLQKGTTVVDWGAGALRSSKGD